MSRRCTVCLEVIVKCAVFDDDLYEDVHDRPSHVSIPTSPSPRGLDWTPASSSYAALWPDGGAKDLVDFCEAEYGYIPTDYYLSVEKRKCQ